MSFGSYDSWKLASPYDADSACCYECGERVSLDELDEDELCPDCQVEPEEEEEEDEPSVWAA